MMTTTNVELINIALSEYGTTEVQGARHNPRIVQYSEDLGYDEIKTDETAWCSIFMNWVAMMAGVVRSDKLNARSWLKVGSEITGMQTLTGDVVIFWRESPESWKGHVGIFINRVGDKVYCLGGNQSNRVSIAAYSAERVLGYRRLYKR